MEDLVCISHLRWDFVWQRPQQLLFRFAQQSRVLFVEEPVCGPADSEPKLEVSPGKEATRVTVVRLVFPLKEERWIGHGDPLTQTTYSALLKDFLLEAGYKNPVLWLYTPMASEFIAVLPHQLLIYDVMDQLSAFKDAPPDLIKKEEQLLRQADLVFTGGASLYRAKLPFNPNTYLFPSGVEEVHFARASDRQAFERPAGLAGIKAPILGYYGVIDERMDFPLLEAVARARPDWNLVLIGPIIKIDPAEIPALPNLHYLPMKTYAELPIYLAFFEVALVPFALNQATQFLSPTKTLEYMAAHKPVVSTPIRDVAELYGEVVKIAGSATEFIARIEEAFTEDPAFRRLREEEFLTLNSWDNIASRMASLVEAKIISSSEGALRGSGDTRGPVPV